MQSIMWRRLQCLEEANEPVVQRVCVYQHVGETSEDVDRKLEAWKAGGELDGLSPMPYDGRELQVRVIKFVKAENRFTDR